MIIRKVRKLDIEMTQTLVEYSWLSAFADGDLFVFKLNAKLMYRML